MKLAIITLNYNGKKDTLEFLESLKILRTQNIELKTIVVDNGSSDQSVSEINKKYPNVDILQSGTNLGFSGGFNKGLDYAMIWGADYFLLINNDCLINDANLIISLLNTIKSDFRIGMVSPKILFADGFEFHKDRYSKEDLGNIIWFAGGKFDWDNIRSIHRGMDEVDRGQYDIEEETEIISGACVLIKKEVLEKTTYFTKLGQGFFDEKYFLYFEDSDFTKRVTELGYKKYYTGKTSIYHKVSQSTGIGSKITDYYHARNRLIFGMKYARARTKFALIRESIKLLLIGRQAERKGIMDFYLGVTGGVNVSKNDEQYPLKLSIAIVNYNTADLIKKLLESIFHKDSGFNKDNMEVIVLDNGNIDPCKEKIKEYLPRIKYLKNTENEGFSKGYNKTIRASLSQYYLMLNSDIEVLESGLSNLLYWADEFNSKAALGGKLVFPDSTDQDSAFHLPTLTGAIKEYFLGIKGSYFMYLPQAAKPVRVEGLVMACLLIPKKVINKVGLLDEGTFIFFEDIEYARRLKNFNVPIYFIPTSKFIHHHGSSTKRIGQVKAYELLKEASEHYHGKLYYTLLSFVLRIGQKLGITKTPVSRWTKT